VKILGTLKEFPIPRLFKAHVDEKFTGALELINGKERRTIQFKEGKIKNAYSNLESDRIYAILHNKGKLSKDLLSKNRDTLKNSGTTQEIQLLMQLGVLDGSEVFSLIENQVKNILLNCYRLQDGAFKVQKASPDEHSSDVVIDISFEKLQWEGIRNHCPESVIVKLLPPEGTIFKPRVNFQESCLRMGLSSADLKTLKLLDGKLTFRNIAQQVNTDLLHLKKLFICLHLLDVIEIVRVVEREITPKTAKKTQPVKKASRKNAARKVEVKELMEKVRQFKRKTEEMNPYQLLGIHMNAEHDQIRTAYRKMVKEYHPDRFRQIGDEELLSVVQTNFLKISDAFRVLSSPLDRKSLDEKLKENKKPVSRQQPAAPRLSPKEEGEKHFNDAMVQFKKENYERAIALLRSAMYRDNTNAKYIATLALVLSHDDQKLLEARGHIMKAIEREPTNGEFHAILGEIYQRGGLNTKAKHSFDKALQLDAGNQRAREGLKNLGKKPSKDGKKSILGKFFKS
jgi:curved DNA-binding protein CbpA